MTLTRRIAAMFAAFAVALTAGLATASPAQAAPSNCANSSVCGYVAGGYYTDQGYEYIPTRSAGTCEWVAHANKWSSFWNNSGRTIRLFKNSNCSGTDYIQYTNGTGHGTLSIRHPSFNDNIESVQFR